MSREVAHGMTYWPTNLIRLAEFMAFDHGHLNLTFNAQRICQSQTHAISYLLFFFGGGGAVIFSQCCCHTIASLVLKTQRFHSHFHTKCRAKTFKLLYDTI